MAEPRKGDELAARIGTMLRERRRQLAMSQADVAARIGVTPQQVQKYESGRNQPSLLRAAVLRRETGISLDELVDGALGDPAEPPEQATDVMYLLRTVRRMNPRQVALLRRIARAITGLGE